MGGVPIGGHFSLFGAVKLVGEKGRGDLFGRGSISDTRRISEKTKKMVWEGHEKGETKKKRASTCQKRDSLITSSFREPRLTEKLLIASRSIENLLRMYLILSYSAAWIRVSKSFIGCV